MKGNTMQKLTLAAVTAATLSAVVLTGCSVDDDDDCRSQPAYIYVVGGVYHYGSTHGPVVNRKYVDPKTGKLKPGVTVSPKGKVNLTKPGNGSKGGSGFGSKPGYKAPSSPSKGGGFGGGRSTSRR